MLDAWSARRSFNSPPASRRPDRRRPTALTTAVEGAEDHPEYGEADLKTIGFNAKDVLVGIATSGRTPYVLGRAGRLRAVVGGVHDRLGLHLVGGAWPLPSISPSCRSSARRW
ncbi:MAG: hypothetical protein U0797_26175 [Gemmataceae bacterium]